MIDLFNSLSPEYRGYIGAGIGATILALITGKTIRRLVLLPFKLIAAYTSTKEDDLLVQEAAKDLGLPEDAANKKDK